MSKWTMVLVVVLLLTGSRSPAASILTEEELTSYVKLIKAIFPDDQVGTEEVEEYEGGPTAIRINPEYRVTWPKSNIKTCVLMVEENGDTIRVVAIGLDPPISEPSYPSRKKIVFAVLRESEGALALLHRSDVPLPGDTIGQGSHCWLKSMRTIELLKRTMVLMEYEFSDSLSTPRGLHVITNLVDFSESYEPRVVWCYKTGYHYGGASQPTKDVVVQFQFYDIHHDGYEQISVEVTTVEHDTYVWDGSGFVKPRMYPPDSFEERMKRQRQEEENLEH